MHEIVLLVLSIPDRHRLQSSTPDIQILVSACVLPICTSPPAHQLSLPRAESLAHSLAAIKSISIFFTLSSCTYFFFFLLAIFYFYSCIYVCIFRINILFSCFLVPPSHAALAHLTFCTSWISPSWFIKNFYLSKKHRFSAILLPSLPCCTFFHTLNYISYSQALSAYLFFLSVNSLSSFSIRVVLINALFFWSPNPYLYIWKNIWYDNLNCIAQRISAYIYFPWSSLFYLFFQYFPSKIIWIFILHIFHSCSICI